MGIHNTYTMLAFDAYTHTHVTHEHAVDTNTQIRIYIYTYNGHTRTYIHIHLPIGRSGCLHTLVDRSTDVTCPHLPLHSLQQRLDVEG